MMLLKSFTLCFCGEKQKQSEKKIIIRGKQKWVVVIVATSPASAASRRPHLEPGDFLADGFGDLLKVCLPLMHLVLQLKHTQTIKKTHISGTAVSRFIPGCDFRVLEQSNHEQQQYQYTLHRNRWAAFHTGCLSFSSVISNIVKEVTQCNTHQPSFCNTWVPLEVLHRFSFHFKIPWLLLLFYLFAPCTFGSYIAFLYFILIFRLWLDAWINLLHTVGQKRKLFLSGKKKRCVTERTNAGARWQRCCCNGERWTIMQAKYDANEQWTRWDGLSGHMASVGKKHFKHQQPTLPCDLWLSQG